MGFRGGGTSFGARTFLTGPLSLLFVLRLEGFLNKTTVVVGVDVLMTRRAIHVETMVTLNAGQTHILLITVRASVSLRAHGGLEVRGGFARMGLAGMGFETRGSKKVPMTRLATLSGFQVSGVRMLKVWTIFLSTGSAQLGLGASMTSLGVVGFPTIRTHITGPEKSRQTSDHVVIVLVVQQDQLFVRKGSKRRDVKRSLCIHQEDLVTGEGRSLTELGQGVVATWTEGYLGLVMKQESQFFLDVAPLSNTVPFRVLVHASFGGDKGSGTAELIVVGNPDDRFGIFSQQVHGGMTWFPTTGSAGTLRSMMNLRDGDLKGIVHFKLFVAVQGLG